MRSAGWALYSLHRVRVTRVPYPIPVDVRLRGPIHRPHRVEDARAVVHGAGEPVAVGIGGRLAGGVGVAVGDAGGLVRRRRAAAGGDWIQAGPLDQLEERQRVFAWLAERVNTFVRVLRPRIRSVAADYQSRSE